jgi:hypothetical protein
MTAPAKAFLPYPPPWQDIVTLAQHLCCSTNTIENWVGQGILPAPRKRGGKLMWKWDEVDRKLTVGAEGASPDQEAERIRNGARAAAAARH